MCVSVPLNLKLILLNWAFIAVLLEADMKHFGMQVIYKVSTPVGERGLVGNRIGQEENYSGNLHQLHGEFWDGYQSCPIGGPNG